MDHSLEILGTTLFAIALLHTFIANQIHSYSHQFKDGSFPRQALRLLGEVEIVFGFWSFWLMLGMFWIVGGTSVSDHLLSLSFTEPAFVFVIMALASTRPVLWGAEKLIEWISRALPLPPSSAFFWVTLVVGPLLGSLITEPAAMTVSALLLKERYFRHSRSDHFKYFALGTLFVNVSIGGSLTHFAAPPILMVAGKWGWDSAYVFGQFGWKYLVAVILSTSICLVWTRADLKKIKLGKLDAREEKQDAATPKWILATHLLFLGLVVWQAHHPAIFAVLFILFLVFSQGTRGHQHPLKLKESFLVAFFLAGLVILGSFQAWWLSPLLGSMGETSLFYLATVLTAVTDNAALTYLGSQVEGLSAAMKIALVSGAVAGGGLTVIANAPNPAGFGILREHFGVKGVNPFKLFAYATIPTAVAVIAHFVLPGF